MVSQISSKRDSFKGIFLIVTCSVPRITMRIASASIKMHLIRTKFNPERLTDPSINLHGWYYTHMHINKYKSYHSWIR